ncbi:MAG: CotH kinase family protein [Bacteroidales bacterium]|nr:CotH kinase family protein [Bacteroidales bacterium]MBN2818397.1 CotH kinase family protein [Bacteroidales bacterium]
MAVEALLGHWDSPTMLSNNYYLYENPSPTMFEFIPYDLDNTLDNDWLGADWGTYSFIDWGLGLWNSKTRSYVVPEIPDFQNRYLSYVGTLRPGVFNPE